VCEKREHIRHPNLPSLEYAVKSVPGRFAPLATSTAPVADTAV
ncbi:uncharacterized protein METZ01_LOCUS240389, partial [marine metagenome]